MKDKRKPRTKRKNEKTKWKKKKVRKEELLQPTLKFNNIRSKSYSVQVESR